MLEDKHIQIDSDNKNIDLDIILRVNDKCTKYIAIDVFDYKQQNILQTIEIEEE